MNHRHGGILARQGLHGENQRISNREGTKRKRKHKKDEAKRGTMVAWSWCGAHGIAADIAEEEGGLRAAPMVSGGASWLNRHA